MHISTLSGYMKSSSLTFWLNSAQNLLFIMFPQVHEDILDRLATGNFSQEALMCVIATSGTHLFVKPVHLELAPLEFVHDLGLVIIIPIIPCIIFEIY